MSLTRGGYSGAEPRFRCRGTSSAGSTREDTRSRGWMVATNSPLKPQERPNVPALLTKAMIRQFFVPAGERTLDRWISSGVFPRPDISIGGKVRYWKRESVEAWIAVQSGTGGSCETL